MFKYICISLIYSSCFFFDGGVEEYLAHGTWHMSVFWNLQDSPQKHEKYKHVHRFSAYSCLFVQKYIASKPAPFLTLYCQPPPHMEPSWGLEILPRCTTGSSVLFTGGGDFPLPVHQAGSHSTPLLFPPSVIRSTPSVRPPSGPLWPHRLQGLCLHFQPQPAVAKRRHAWPRTDPACVFTVISGTWDASFATQLARQYWDNVWPAPAPPACLPSTGGVGQAGGRGGRARPFLGGGVASGGRG